MSLRRTRRRDDIEDLIIDYADDDQGLDIAYIRLKAPIVWEEWPPCFLIQDLQDTFYDEAINLIKTSYMTRETMCRSIKITDDPESVEAYENYLRLILKDSCSIMVLNKDTNELVAVLLLKVMLKANFGKVFSRIKMFQGVKFQKIIELQKHLNRKRDLFEICDCDKYLRFSLMDVHPDYDEDSLSLGLIKCGFRVARSLQIPQAMSIFTTTKMQDRAKLFGMRIIYEVFYVDWREDKKMVFDDPGVGNYTAALMVGSVPPPKSSQTYLNIT